MSVLSTFTNVEHKFASVLHDVYTGAKAVEKFTAGLASNSTLQNVVEGVSAVTLGPASVEIERVAFAALGSIASVVASGEAAGVAKLKDLGLDDAFVAQIKAFLPTIKAELANVGIKL